MAGFGKFFNYETPGPGIDKNAPKKTGFALFWEIFLSKFWNFIPLSLLYIVMCLPVVTIGLADVGITYITRNYAREKPVFMVSDFFATIKKNWKQAFVVGFVNLIVTVALIGLMILDFSAWNESLIYQIGFVLCGCLLIIFTFLKYYINMLIVTFRLSTFNLYRNSLLLSSAGLKENLIISGMLVAVYGLLFGLPIAIAGIDPDIAATLSIIFLVLAILFVPAIQSFIIQFWIFGVVKKNMIDPYYEAHPEEAKRDKALLNLFEDEEDEDGEESIFTDLGSREPRTHTESTIPKQYSTKDIEQHRRHSREDDDTI